MGDSAGFKAEEEHDYAADDGDNADPVNGFNAGDEGGARVLELEEEGEHEKGGPVKRKINVEL